MKPICLAVSCCLVGNNSGWSLAIAGCSTKLSGSAHWMCPNGLQFEQGPSAHGACSTRVRHSSISADRSS